VLIATVASVLIVVLLPSDKPADEPHGPNHTSQSSGIANDHK
jgi:hypothetical protein